MRTQSPLSFHQRKAERLETLTTESEEEAETVRNRGKFVVSEQSRKLLAEVTARFLKNARCRQLLDRFTHPADCDQAYTPKLDDSIWSISLTVPESSRKEDWLFSHLQQFTMDSLGALVFLQEQLAEGTTSDPKKVRAAVKTTITLLENAVVQFNIEHCKCAMKHLNKDL